MKQLTSGLALLLLATMLPAATCYWKNGSGDSRWSNPANWTNNAKPASNDVVRLGNDCPDEAQNIILDEVAWLTQISCTATGNRDYRITPENSEFIRLNSSYALLGDGNRTAALTIDADVKVGSDFLRVYCYGSKTVFNGQIMPSPGERESVYLLPQYSHGPVVLAASNILSSISCQNNANVAVKHPHALGQGGFRAVSCSERGLLTLMTTNVVINGMLQPSSPIELEIAETGEDEVVLHVGNLNAPGNIRLRPYGANANGNFVLRLSKADNIVYPTIALEEFGSLSFDNESGTINWSNAANPHFGAVTGAGKVVVNGNVFLGSTNNTYTGGTYITRGALNMYRESGLPTNGVVWLSEGATINGNNTSYNHVFGGLHGAGTLTTAIFTIIRSLEPGMEGPGTLLFTSSAKLVLGPETVTTFELDALDGVNDHVSMLHSSSNLTLDGTLRIVNRGNLETGSYKLFDLAGAGRVFGQFKSIEMPPASSGEIEIDSGGDVILKVTREYGTILSIR